MSQEFDEMVAHLKWLNFRIGHSCDQAEAKMAEVNRLLEQLAQTGWLQETVILGEVIHQRYYVPSAGGHDSSQVVQAALCLPGDLGVVLWDSDDYTQLREIPQGLEAEARPAFQSFECCEPALKALLFPHVEALLHQLRRQWP
ncbi:MAG TPA: hypothetical protein VH575_27145 [Gemmataceae bacterium]|jgi:hypothetical protein